MRKNGECTDKLVEGLKEMWRDDKCSRQALKRVDTPARSIGFEGREEMMFDLAPAERGNK
jgi:hypothetical protein